MQQPTPAERTARVAAVFDRVADTYDSVGVPWFTPIAEGLVAALDPRPGERALDVGCGRGAALLPLAAGVGPTGSVTGIDLAAAMIAATSRAATQRELSVELHVMDAAAPDLPPASYDVVASSLVLFFLPDPLEALRRWVQLLAPGGRLGLATFAKQDARWLELDALFTPYLPPQMLDARASGTRGPFASDDALAALCTAAGLVDVQTTHADIQAQFKDAKHWLAWSWSHGQRALWEAVPQSQRPEVEAAAADILAAAAAPDGRVGLSQRVRYTLGHRPS